MFAPDLERNAFRSGNGEFGWTREQVSVVVETLRSRQLGILGGELWWIREGVEGWVGLIPQRHGPPAVYHWETNPRPGGTWMEFVERGASDALAAVQRWPGPDDLPRDIQGRILYNLTWAAETDAAVR